MRRRAGSADLVGPNGSGKSNFLDALRFVSDCLNTSVDQALRVRGGFRSVCRTTGKGKEPFSIKLTLLLDEIGAVEYFFEIGANTERSFEVLNETFKSDDKGYIRTKSGHVKKTSTVANTATQMLVEVADQHQPTPSPDRLYLGRAGFWEFHQVQQALADMAFYNPSIGQMQDYQSPDPGDRLNPDASNAASVFRTLRKTNPDWAERILQYLSAAVPRLTNVVDADVGEKVTLQFTEATGDGHAERSFYASSMSGGTLRMVALLLALFQRTEPQRVSLVGIEEPEMGVHPAAAGVLFDSLSEASYFRQVLVTSHSSELLDRDEVDVETLLAVSAESGTTTIGPLDGRQKEILKNRLGTAGELLRNNLLSPERAEVVSDI